MYLKRFLVIQTIELQTIRTIKPLSTLPYDTRPNSFLISLSKYISEILQIKLIKNIVSIQFKKVSASANFLQLKMQL